MVDLHDVLRPTEVVTPLPVSEIAGRARRRRRRRLATVTATLTLTLGTAALAVGSSLPPPDGAVTVADGAATPDVVGSDAAVPDQTAADGDGGQPSSSVTVPPAETVTSSRTPIDDRPPTSSSGSAPTGPDATASTTTGAASGDPLATTPGLQTSTTITSEWEDGYCLAVEVINEATTPVVWRVVFDLDGSIASLWNATAVDVDGGSAAFTGLEGYNTSIAPGAATSFGACVDVGPSRS